MEKLISGCITIVIVSIILGALSGFVFMALWNWLAPLFWTSAPHLTFWQAWGICILLSWIGSLFKNNSK